MTANGFETEEVPPEKRFMISTRSNSEYKWQTSKIIIGALEVNSEPDLRIHDEYNQRAVPGKEKEFEKVMEVWEEWGLREQFIEACENVPAATCCCGLVRDDDTMIQELVPVLNQGWVKAVNKRLLTEQKGFKIDIFNWNWHNATGKALTNILLIRFFLRGPVVGNAP